MLKETENEETSFFVKFLSLVAIQLKGLGPTAPPPPHIRLWFWDKIALLSSFIKNHLKQNSKKNFFFKTWRNRVKSLDSFLKPSEIAWHYYDVDTWWSLLLLVFVRINPNLKKLQFRTRTTYWLCSHSIYHWKYFIWGFALPVVLWH